MVDVTDNKQLRKLLLSWTDKAMDHLYYHCFKTLLKISEARTHDHEASKDIVQDALIKLYERSEWIIEREGFLIWQYLVTIVINNSIKHFNKAIRHAHQDIHELSGDFTAYVQELEQFLISRNKTIWRIVSTLPAEERVCLTMKFYQGMKNEAIAQELGISVKTVEARVTKSYKTLRQYRSLIY